jgi:hypothetical protein
MGTAGRKNEYRGKGKIGTESGLLKVGKDTNHCEKVGEKNGLKHVKENEANRIKRERQGMEQM